MRIIHIFLIWFDTIKSTLNFKICILSWTICKIVSELWDGKNRSFVSSFVLTGNFFGIFHKWCPNFKQARVCKIRTLWDIRKEGDKRIWTSEIRISNSSISKHLIQSWKKLILPYLYKWSCRATLQCKNCHLESPFHSSAFLSSQLYSSFVMFCTWIT